MALTFSSMLLTSRILAALAPVICCICWLTSFSEAWATAATAMSSASMQPNPRNSRREMEKVLKNEAVCMVFSVADGL